MRQEAVLAAHRRRSETPKVKVEANTPAVLSKTEFLTVKERGIAGCSFCGTSEG
jgi:hypothetical protein